MASTLQLEFAQAMSDFKTMFPDMERDVIEAVLRANQGAVDATIDQLLAMSTDNQVCYQAYLYSTLVAEKCQQRNIYSSCALSIRTKNYVMNWSKVPHHHRECKKNRALLKRI